MLLNFIIGIDSGILLYCLFSNIFPSENDEYTLSKHDLQQNQTDTSLWHLVDLELKTRIDGADSSGELDGLMQPELAGL